MQSNVEIKARVPDLAAVRSRALAAGASAEATLRQIDTFFRVPAGRLKLRDFGDGSGELIYYVRPDRAGPKRSQYTIFETASPAALGAILAEALGERGVVEKRRELLVVGQTRIHLDEVRGLGSFLELEVVLDDGQSAADGATIARDLLRRLQIPDGSLVAGAYIDLLDPGDA